MSRAIKRDLGASVMARLKNLGAERGEDVQLLLTRFAIERFLRRLEACGHGRDFVLKGAMLFVARGDWPYRPTRDLDLLASPGVTAASLEALVREACAVPVEDDALRFDPASVRVRAIMGERPNEGQRVELMVYLARVRIRLQVDIGFGDAVVPPPEELAYPSQLGFPAPRVRAYPAEAVVAEKIEAILTLGATNSRMKDYYDIWALSSRLGFEGPVLVSAMYATLARRGTSVPEGVPPGLESEFADAHEGMWQGFVRRTSLTAAAPTLEAAVKSVSSFALPPLGAVRAGGPFEMTWPPGGPWR